MSKPAEYLDERLDKKTYKKHLVPAPANNPKRLPPCIACATPTKQICSECKAISVCSKECFRSIWKSHKSGCRNVRDARRRIANDPGAPPSHFPKQVPSIADPITLLAFDKKCNGVYAKHGVIGEAPVASTHMPSETLVLFFTDMLEVCDAGSPANKDVDLPLRLFMNRRYNNTYTHVVNNFQAHPERVLDRVNALCAERKIGDYCR